MEGKVPVMVSSTSMGREHILAALHKGRHRFGDFHVASLSLFGSAARDEMTQQSDVDVLVSFTGPATLEDFMGLKEYLEGLLGVTVDLVTDKALKPRMRRRVHEESVRVA